MKRLRDKKEESLDNKIEKLNEVLKRSYGYPSPDLNLKDIKKLFIKNLASTCPTFETACGAVYWINATKEWIDEQPWSHHLWCEPIKNPLAPSNDLKDNSFSVLHKHPSKTNWYGIPKFLGLSLFGQAFKDIRSVGLEMKVDVSMNPSRTLREYQIAAQQAALKDLQLWGGSTIIADCGAGKTAIALSIAEKIRRKTLIICNREFLMTQWKGEIQGTPKVWSGNESPIKNSFMKYRVKCRNCSKRGNAFEFDEELNLESIACPKCNTNFDREQWEHIVDAKDGWLSKANVGWIQGPLVDIEDKDFVVASIDSLAQCEYDPQIFSNFGLVIIDEMHHLAAKSLSKVLPKIPARYIVGISATPDRNDGLEFLLYWLAGPTSFVYKRLPEITGLHHTVLVHQYIFKNGVEKEVFYAGGKLGFASMISSLALEETRNNFILEIIQNLTKPIANRRKVLIVTSIVNHAKFLADTLQCTMINGGCAPHLVAKAKSAETKIVVATYQFLEEGFDDPLIDTLILALPRSKIQQVVGRCERTHEGKLTPIVIDIIDPFSIFQAMSWKRKRFYDSRGFKISVVQ